MGRPGIAEGINDMVKLGFNKDTKFELNVSSYLHMTPAEIQDLLQSKGN